MLICLFKMVVRPMGIYYAAVSALVCVSANFCNKMLVEGNGAFAVWMPWYQRKLRASRKKNQWGHFSEYIYCLSVQEAWKGGRDEHKRMFNIFVHYFPGRNAAVKLFTLFSVHFLA